MLTSLGVRFYPDRPVEVPGTLSEAYKKIVVPASTTLELHYTVLKELQSLPESARESKLPDLQATEAGISAALEQLEACSGGTMEPQRLAPPILAEQCLAAARKLVEQLWAGAAASNPSMDPGSTAEGSAGVVTQQLSGGPGSIMVRQLNSSADLKQLQELLACSIAMVIAVHDSAKHPAEDVTTVLEILAARMVPQGKMTAIHHEEMLHSVSSFCEATRLLSMS
eukprot:TRINITY_DN12170_c0_g1_i3.p1 TRINITY_DN12170_c0_g1~~TRINITY_DN12170_c0_g1_i3.p1  ORF type:complete len:225 (+),score=70.35 TRINITY_DN12170_c0_g1_i3:224-898(+)